MENKNMLLEFQVSQLISARATLKEVDKLFAQYAKKGEMADLKQAYDMLLKVTKETEGAVKANTPAPSTEAGVDWDKDPKAPVNILRLKDKYPDKEEAYWRAWKRAVEKTGWEPGKKLNYGAAISIFKNYARRPEFDFQMESEEELDAEVLELDKVNEDGDSPAANESNTSFRIKRFEDFR